MLPKPPRQVFVEQRVDLSDAMRRSGAGHIGQPAGFWIRVCALVLDTLVMFVIGAMVYAALLLVIGLPRPGTGRGISLAFQIMPSLAAYAYVVIMQTGAWQATVGKRAVGIYVRRSDGHTLTIGQAFGREFAKILSAVLLYIGFFMVGWNREKKGLHDIVAGSRVVHGKL